MLFIANQPEGVTSLYEPNFLLYEVTNPLLNEASQRLKGCLTHVAEDQTIVVVARNQRVQRLKLWNEGVKRTVSEMPVVAFYCH